MAIAPTASMVEVYHIHQVDLVSPVKLFPNQRTQFFEDRLKKMNEFLHLLKLYLELGFLIFRSLHDQANTSDKDEEMCFPYMMN